MNRFFTLLRVSVDMKRAVCKAGSLFLFIATLFFSNRSSGQFTLQANKTAAQLAADLAGTGVTIITPTLTCAGNANASFTTGAISPIGIPTGIVLTNGDAKDTMGGYGVGDPSIDFASTGNGTAGDAQLTALAGEPTHDACILQFYFKPAGDTIKFNYVFGSEEYTDYTCSPFNDVFAFFITGGAYGTGGGTNLALVPGTTIPIAINSVNCGATGGYTIGACTAMGAGSPFCAYYINNTVTTSAAYNYCTYDGLTTVLTAIAAVSPCDTYHLKIAIADASDDVFDSGVFLEGGSLTSNTTTAVTATGTSGLPYCIRGCNPGNFIFSTPVAQDTNIIIRFIVTGTAVNGYDYSTIPDSAVILAGRLSDTLDINTLPVTPVGPKIVTLEIEVPNPCIPDSFTIGGTASLTILDSFTFHIITPDTAICNGQLVNIIATGDSIFDSILHYTWTGLGTVSADTFLDVTVTPTITGTYVLTGTTAAVLGCAPESRDVTIRVYDRPILTVDSALVKTCVGIPVLLHVYANPDTVPNTYLWAPPTDLSSTTIYDPTVDPTTTGNVTYTVTVNPTAIPGCTSTATITVHTVPNNFTLNNVDTVICLGASIQASISGGSAEFTWLWTPPNGVSNVNIMDPLITPTITTTYTITASYAHCPNMIDSFNIAVDYPAPAANYSDTICLGLSYSVNVADTGSGYYHYQWAPPTFVSNDTIPDPVITPTVEGSYSWTVTIQPPAAACAIIDDVNLLVIPNSFTISPTDTTICKGNSIQVLGTPFELFAYSWTPTEGIITPNILTPVITPDTSTMYIVTATYSKCPEMRDTLIINVQPNPTAYIGGNRFVCEFDTLHLNASISPAWFTQYTYNWAPASVLDNDTSNTVVFSGDTSTMITFTVTTSAGCSAVDSADITVYPGNFAGLAPNSLNFCPHDTAILSPSGGVSYSWSPSLYLTSAGLQTIIAPITTQTYTIVATSSNGCLDILNFTATVYPGAVIYLPDSAVTLYPGETYQMDPQTNCTSFAWFPPAGLNNAYISNPIANPVLSTEYVVYGTTEWGCKTSDSINIYVDPQSLLALPNAFTPGNGPNNEFKIIIQGIATLNYFRIFNRWGNLVFETNNINQGWNGEYNGVPQPMDVYVYEVEAVTSTGEIFKKHGNTTLLR